MMKIIEKGKLKDALLLLGIIMSFVLALVGICFGAVETDLGNHTKVISFFGGLADDTTATAKAALAFSLIGFFALVSVVVFAALELFGVAGKVTKFKMYASFATMVLLLIAIACMGGVVKDGGANVSGGMVLLFVFGYVCSGLALFFNRRGWKFWQDPNKETAKVEVVPLEDPQEKEEAEKDAE